MKNIVVFGASGAIGSEFLSQLSKKYADAKIFAFSRGVFEQCVGNVSFHAIDYEEEASLERAANVICKDEEIDMVVVAIGILHDSQVNPERSIKEISKEKMQHVYQVNSVIPMLIAKYFIGKLQQGVRSFFAFLSARVGSIADNKLGGWYSYRASKAALNMLIKTLSIELQRVNPQAVVVGLHPGTVDSALSKPFQGNIIASKLFSPQHAVENLIDVLEQLSTKESGRCFGWDGKEIEP